MFFPRYLTFLLASTLLLAGCASQSTPTTPFAIEPLGQALPQTSARAALIDQIIASDPVVILSLKPVLDPKTSNDERIATLRKKNSDALPEGYWALYKKNLEALQYDLNHQHEAARDQYVKTYRDELSRVDDATLQAMATAPQTLDETNRRQWSARMSGRASRYMVTSEQAVNAATDAHIKRMALMDRQYNVCASNPECWDAPVKK